MRKRLTQKKRYLSDDPTQTEKAFDSEGFFKTGDCAEKLGDSYILHGRANIDGLEILAHDFKQYNF
jgi:non-ribosomal peptide synthetase component E (peptide arylation enzyme)